MSLLVQPGRGENHSLTAKAMPNEALIIHVPDPAQGKLIKVNDITETRYARVIAVGEPTGRYRKAPVEVGDIVVMQTATAGVGVGTLHFDNKPLHRLDWRNIMAIAENYDE
jgi:co-chaperonin GroES (HSP10)